MEIKLRLLMMAWWFLGMAVNAQPGTEVVLMDLYLSADSVAVSNPLNISNNKGYDNQPHFSNNGKFLLYSSQRGNQTEVMQHDLMSGEVLKVTSSAGSEYSPTFTPDGSHFSTIILESSGRQLLWQYTLEGKEPSVVVPDLKIGYHCWLEPKLLAAFVLGETATLQLCDLSSGDNKVIARNIGRSLHKIPGTSVLCYVDKAGEPWKLVSYDWQTGERMILANCLQGSEDFALGPQGEIFMGKGNTLYVWTVGSNMWRTVRDFSSLGWKEISRLAVSPGGDQIAVVIADPD